jgi:hypothetical protein
MLISSNDLHAHLSSPHLSKNQPQNILIIQNNDNETTSQMICPSYVLQCVLRQVGLELAALGNTIAPTRISTTQAGVLALSTAVLGAAVDELVVLPAR